jgi:hypothetical protein
VATNAILISRLLQDISPITKVLGEPRKEGGELSFPVGATLFSRLTAGYELKKYFLGRIYHLVLEARFAILAPVSFCGTLELHFAGLVKKGNPSFVLKGGPLKNRAVSGWVLRLNGDQDLMADCLKLDIEFLRILFDPLDGWGRVQAGPYGGSLIRLYLPPLNYHVKLIKEQALLLLSVLQRIGNAYHDFQAHPAPDRSLEASRPLPNGAACG